MAQTKSPSKPTTKQLGTERRVPREANVAESIGGPPVGQLQTIRDSFKIADENLDRLLNLAYNIRTSLIGNAPEEPRQDIALPDGELYVIPIRIQDINERLGELDSILQRVYETL